MCRIISKRNCTCSKDTDDLCYRHSHNQPIESRVSRKHVGCLHCFCTRRCVKGETHTFDNQCLYDIIHLIACDDWSCAATIEAVRIRWQDPISARYGDEDLTVTRDVTCVRLKCNNSRIHHLCQTALTAWWSVSFDRRTSYSHTLLLTQSYDAMTLFFLRPSHRDTSASQTSCSLIGDFFRRSASSSDEGVDSSGTAERQNTSMSKRGSWRIVYCWVIHIYVQER